MTLTIALESPVSQDGRALIAGSQAAMEEIYPPDEIFSLRPEELDRPEVAFLVARRADGVAVGCVALVDCGGYCEVKRLYTRPEARGSGAAKALMAALEAEAKARGITEILLETGPRLAAAMQLYRRLGYQSRGPFGDYPPHPASAFMEKHIA